MEELNGHNEPMKDYQRVIIETNEEHPKIIAQVTARDFDVLGDFRVRLQPVYKE